MTTDGMTANLLAGALGELLAHFGAIERGQIYTAPQLVERAADYLHEQRTGPDHQPHRASEVCLWLKKWRNEYEPQTEAWTAIDNMLDNYRLMADIGFSMRKARVAGIEDEDDNRPGL